MSGGTLMKQLSLRTYVRGQCVSLNKVMFLKAASRLEPSPQSPPEALTPPLSPSPWPRRPVSGQQLPPLSPCPPPAHPRLRSPLALPGLPAQLVSVSCSLPPPPAGLSPVSAACSAQPSAVLCRQDLGQGPSEPPWAPSCSEAAVGSVTPHSLAACSCCPLPTAWFCGGWGTAHSGPPARHPA